jgi:hypothetical protein
MKVIVRPNKLPSITARILPMAASQTCGLSPRRSMMIMAASVERAPALSPRRSQRKSEMMMPPTMLQGSGNPRNKIITPVTAPTRLALIRVSARVTASFPSGDKTSTTEIKLQGKSIHRPTALETRKLKRIPHIHFPMYTRRLLFRGERLTVYLK